MIKKSDPFAHHGSTKMIYDVRMGPQGIHHKKTFYITYQANPDGGKALPHIIKRDPDGSWSAPVVLGDVLGYDHHFAPVLWVDLKKHLHVLYNCHIGLNKAVHKISKDPLSINAWQDGPEIAPSISYPKVLQCTTGRLVLYYRSLGHMGNWTYRISDDGGYTWTGPSIPQIDFDYLPQTPGDESAGSYHNVKLSRNGRFLHIAMVYKDERHLPHPLYAIRPKNMNKYNLYYVKLDLLSGHLFNIDEKKINQPLNKKEAEKCLVWDTGNYLTNMPSILLDKNEYPSFLVPVSGKSLNDCCFWFIKREGDRWSRSRVTSTDNTWNGSHLEYGENEEISAFLIAGISHTENLKYGGGSLQEWHSGDNGETWKLKTPITSESKFFYNNPKPVEDFSGASLNRTLLFFGWEGPDDISSSGPFTGQSYLWQEGNWL